MGQTSIFMLNKVGYSMFWGSMWDNKINYSTNLKENIYLDKYFKLIFNDNVSSSFHSFFNSKKLLIRKKLKVKKIKFKLNNQVELNYPNVINSKIWILKFQKWVIIYNFYFLINEKSYDKLNLSVFNNINIYDAYLKTFIKNKFSINLFF